VEIDAQLRLSLHIVPHVGHKLTIVLPERDPDQHSYVLECKQRLAPREVYEQRGEPAPLSVAQGACPRSQTWQRQLAPQQVSALAQLLDGVVLPAIPPMCMLGREGTSFTLELALESNRIQFSWSAGLPAAWEVIGGITQLLITIATPLHRDEYHLHRRAS
jgi:hypothetical protein